MTSEKSDNEELAPWEAEWRRTHPHAANQEIAERKRLTVLTIYSANELREAFFDGWHTSERQSEARVRELEAKLDGSAANDAFDAIAKLCGCERWDYPGQLVRDVERLKADRDRSRATAYDYEVEVSNFEEEVARLKALVADGRVVARIRAIIEPLRELHEKAFCAPWTYSQWEVECETCSAGTDTPEGHDECPETDCDGTHVPNITIESPEEYPGPPGQIVAQFRVPGLQTLAYRNGALIVALRNALPELLSALEPQQLMQPAGLKEEP